LLLMKNDVPKAMDSYRAMIKADPASAANGHFRIAKLQEAQQQWAQAEQSYRTTIKLDPGHAAAYNNLAYMLASRGQQLDEALRLANRAVELAPKDPSMLDTLGWVYRARGDLQMAAKTIGRAIAARPQVAVFHYHLGIVQSELGRKAEAEASLKRALELDPKFRGADDAQQRLQKLVAAGR
jgi:tetratricopeptide (TPR) repeat protein